MAHTGGAAVSSADSISDGRAERYLLEYEVARLDAAKALLELHRQLVSGAGTRAVAKAARESHLASARLYTAAACLISPP